VEHQLEALAEGLHLGAAKLVDSAEFRLTLDCIDDGAGDVADEHRLEAGVTATENREHRQDARQRSEAVEEMIVRPEHDRRAEDDGIGPRLQHRGFTCRLAAGIRRRRTGVGADRGDVNHAIDVGTARSLGDGTGAEAMNRVETLAAALTENGDEIDDGVSIGDGAIDRPAIPEIGLHRLDPADHAERLKVAGEIGAADRGPHPPAALQEGTDDLAAEEAGAAKYRHQTLVGSGECHLVMLRLVQGRLISAGTAAVQAAERRDGNRAMWGKSR